MDKKKASFIPSSSEKAFVYQQTQDLISYICEPSTISVFLERATSSSSKHVYSVTFVLNSPSAPIVARSEGESLLEACISSKNQMKERISSLSASTMSSSERSSFIEACKKYPYIH